MSSVDSVVDSVERTLKTTCPACKKETLTITAITHTVAYFGEIIQNVAVCENCGFKHTDVSIAGQKEPMRYKYHVTSRDDMSVRVVRSTSGTVRIPEMGALIEPGPAAEAYITNIEGILDRIRTAVLIARHDPESQEAFERCDQVLEQIEMAREGRFEFTLIIDDPYGNSAIISEEVEKRPLTRDEIEELRPGEYVLEIGEVSDEAVQE